jgi:hypothetical protein
VVTKGSSPPHHLRANDDVVDRDVHELDEVTGKACVKCMFGLSAFVHT